MTGERGPATLRLASYNTRDFLDDRHAAARVVRALAPDVLCLQEVPRRLLGGRRVRAFAAEGGMGWGGGHRGSGGTTVLTGPRVTRLALEHHRLPVLPGVRTRGYAVARVALGDRPPLTVVSVHLSLSPAQRVRHVHRLLGVVEPDGSATRTLVAGDLNEGPDGAAYGVLSTRHRAATDGTPTFPVWAPDKALDVVLATPDLLVRPGDPVDLDEDDVRAASDHRPVWVEVEV
ncbi:endonuclease/exonuclease/phosphatase family protein [Lapillicoccus jejuensis]|uniref:Endonuclease/exonuclease/phosphatase family metal-dependent hydrolase n=1 Tax=Lapillicoccus jejuensis TaxID=402171 RepID=A0A542E5V0_9MICO|nr:endonuclease/exonuclease/phosphatase family protein [Lapillicoccus jejuensis]TQJ10639.1 endonuclease/exonuclease/phosphatase family metal-dependent hydrolase [Lapillicoccus jejuensis]